MEKIDFKPHFSDDWYNRLQDLLESEKMLDLFSFIRKRKQQINAPYSGGVYPESKNVFRVFRECNYDDVKIVILGQD